MLFKKNKIAAPCACEGNNENCDLVLSLREKQKLSKQIKDEITTLDKKCCGLIRDFVNFIIALQSNGYHMDVDYVNRYVNTHEHIIEYTINEYASADILKIAEGLLAYTNNKNLIAEKQKALKVIEDEIKDIKSKLGIE